MELLANLNERQKEAVTKTEGPIMVMAGAGSGKTRVLTHRIAYLILECGVMPSHILAVTFTNKAAREMKERIETLTGQSTRNMWVSTFHSFCAKFLRIEINGFKGYDSNFTIIDEDDSLKIIRDILKNENIDQKLYKPKTFQNLISNEKNKESVEIQDPYLEKIYPRILNKYMEALKHDNLLDFDDLITLTIELLKSDSSLLEKYQRRFEYVMVDEFQDTNMIQYELIKLLAGGYNNIFIVGDQDQSIYSFRGARVENIDKFLNDYNDVTTILLEQNYRSTEPILNIANTVIDKNSNRIKKNLFTSKESTEKPVYYHANSGYDEVMFVVDKIKELHNAGYPYSDFAILYRANSLSRQFEDMLVKHRMPYEVYGGISFFERKEIKDMLAYLRLAINFNDDFSFKRIVNEPKRKIGDALIEKLNVAANNNNCSLFEAIDHIETSGIGYNNLIGFKFNMLEIREYLSDSEHELINVIDEILTKTLYGDMLKNEGEDGKNRLENILELKNVLKEAEEFYEYNDKIQILNEFLSDLALRTDTDDKTEDDDKIKLMTYHQAKGLEYRVVFMVAMEQGIFPSNNCFGFKEMEEERRICYVGITRAKEKLYLSNAESRYLYGQQNSQMPSQYIKEIGIENLNVIGGRVVRPITPISNNKSKEEVKVVSAEINVGDNINSLAYGDGKVVEKNGAIITVAFAAPYGVKKLKADHPSIRKI